MTDTQYKLIIFDLDGTLANQETGTLLDGVYEWFFADKSAAVYAIATNQGGVALRHWMQRDKFGNPDPYPTETAIRARIDSVIEALPIERHSIIPLVCFAYRSKSSGKVAPRPDDIQHDYEWDLAYRKPAPGMLLMVMREASVQADQTLMVGDGEEDKAAAENAGCHFQWAWEFFGREAPEVGDDD